MNKTPKSKVHDPRKLGWMKGFPPPHEKVVRFAVGTRICSLRRVIRLCRVGRINLSGGFVTCQTEIALWPGAHMVRSYM